MLTERYSIEQLILQNLLKNLRTERMLTQGALAEKLNIPQSLISKYESGERHLDFVEILTLCEAFGIGISEFSRLFEESLKINESK